MASRILASPRALLLAVALLLASACERERPAPAPPAPARGLRFQPAPPGAVDEVVRAAAAAAAREGRAFLVYEGATWCEPCKAFHAAAERGELDDVLPAMTFLEFDADADQARLDAAGYGSPYVPLFAVPAPDGRASGRSWAGVDKTVPVAQYLGPRIQALLAP